MGHSSSIKELQKQDKEFSDYIQKATDLLKKRAKPEEDNFQKKIDDFYNQNNWDKQPIARGESFDYRQAAEFSLDAIDGMLEAIAKAVFAGGAVPGGTVIDDAKAVAQVAAEMIDFQVLALVAAKAFINNVLGAFDTSVSTEYHSIIQQKSLAPGLTLHAWNYGDAFQQKNFFNNQFIIENGLAFQLTYSFAQAQMQQDIEYMNVHTQEISEADTSIAAMQKKIDDMAQDIEVSMDTLQAWQDRVTFLQKGLDLYQKQVEDLVEKYKREGNK